MKDEQKDTVGMYCIMWESETGRRDRGMAYLTKDQAESNCNSLNKTNPKTKHWIEQL